MINENEKTIAGPPGRLYFHKLSDDPDRRQLAAFLFSGQYRNIVIFGGEYEAKDLVMELAQRAQSIPPIRNLGFLVTNNRDDLRNPDTDILYFVSMMNPYDIKQFRYIVHICGYSGDIIVPESEKPAVDVTGPDGFAPAFEQWDRLPDGIDSPKSRMEFMDECTNSIVVPIAPRRLAASELEYVAQRRKIISDPAPLPPSMYLWPLQPFETARPIAEYCFPCAGTYRLTWSFARLLLHHGWSVKDNISLGRNSKYVNSLRTKSGFECPRREDFENVINMHINSLDYFQCREIHENVSLSPFTGSNCTFVVLLRDPRDIITSYYHTSIFTKSNETNGNYSHSEWLLHLLQGGPHFNFVKENYVLLWPDAKTMVDYFLTVLESPNMHFIRFEDMHRNDPLALKDISTRIGIYPHPFINFTDVCFIFTSYLSTFEHQTKGKRQRGVDGILKDKRHSSCRKGVTGDWRNLFTPEIVDLFKEMTGDGLVRLGYEKDTNWSL